MHRYLIHGLDVASEYELDAHPADVAGPPDYEIRSGEARPVGGRPDEPGMIAAELERGGSAEWLLERPDGSWLLRYAATADFEIDRAAGRIVTRLAPQVPEGLAPILAGGGVLSYLASGPDRLVLHAAAVEVAGRAVAVVGASGAGKSTTAAHLCLAGARLLADDTLVVSFSGPAGSAPPRAHRGSRTIRLRPEGHGRFEAGEPVLERGSTADGRLLLRPAAAPEPEAELAIVLAVEYVEARAPIELRREGEIDAKRSLLAHPRAAGWRDPDRLRRQFELTTRLAEAVPVLRATLPDRPASEPLGPELGAAIEARLASLSG